MTTVYTINEPPRPYGTLFNGPLWRNGFRPFFLGGALFAGVAVPIWSMILAGAAAPNGSIPAYAWHAHEMIFGFFAAILGGFLLAAIPNWTGRPPLSKAPLAALFGLWVLGRVSMAALVIVPNLSTITRDFLVLCDLSYLVGLALVAARQVATAKALHNFPVVILVSVLALANLWVHGALALEWDWTRGIHTALSVAMVLMVLIGGRTIPLFTRNWLVQNGQGQTDLPPSFSPPDKIAIGATALAAAAWIGLPEFYGTGVLLGVAAAANLFRLARWQGVRTFREPLVFILHIGYLWLAVAQGALGIAIARPDLFPASTALHALTAGAMGVMMAAFMTRASRGHTGHPLKADRATTALYALINGGALLRIAAPFMPFDYGIAIAVSGTLWSLGFLIFVWRYGPWLMSPKK